MILVKIKIKCNKNLFWTTVTKISLSDHLYMLQWDNFLQGLWKALIDGKILPRKFKIQLMGS